MNDKSVRYIPRYGMHGGSHRCNASRIARNRPSEHTTACSFVMVCLICIQTYIHKYITYINKGHHSNYDTPGYSRRPIANLVNSGVPIPSVMVMNFGHILHVLAAWLLTIRHIIQSPQIIIIAVGSNACAIYLHAHTITQHQTEVGE